MIAGVLFSGGKDSALAALFLSRDYEVELNTFVFNPHRDLSAVEHAAASLGFPLKKRMFEPEVLNEAVNMALQCGYPNDAIQYIHRNAILALSKEYQVVGDGTRLNDRVPMLNLGEVMSLANRFGCSYVRPLLGFGKGEIDRLVARHLEVLYGETGAIPNGDYEYELRTALRSRGYDPGAVFPEYHRQSLVTDAKC